MAFCPNCGTNSEGKFCVKCGAPMPAAAAGGTAYVPPPAAPVAPGVQSAGMEENIASALCYVVGWITGVVFLVLDPYNKNRTIRFHAFQSIFLNVAMLAIYIVLGIFSAILMHIIPLLGILFTLAYAVMGLGFFCLWLFLIYKAYNKEKFLLPIIGPMAEKQANA